MENFCLENLRGKEVNNRVPPDVPVFFGRDPEPELKLDPVPVKM